MGSHLSFYTSLKLEAVISLYISRTLREIIADTEEYHNTLLCSKAEHFGVHLFSWAMVKASMKEDGFQKRLLFILGERWVNGTVIKSEIFSMFERSFPPVTNIE